MDMGERYVLGRLIGEGATAHVFEAEDTVLRRVVAVKVFRDVDIGNSTSERIDEETRILASLNHPHLLPVYDSGRGEDGHRFIVMPLVRGITLAELAALGPVEPQQAKRIGKALADALSHIHSRGIVHRDVKPSNVLLADDGTPYLADFGFAHAADGPALTATDCVVGTAGYLAPEQAEGLPVTPAVDVYALGLVLLEALTGEREYHGTPLERATANALRPPGIPARLGPGWLKVLRTLTARTPSARPTADEANLLMNAGEDVLPEVSASDNTMALPVADLWSGSSVGAAEPGYIAVPSAAACSDRADGAGRLRAHRRLAALGAVFFTSVAIVSVGADWLTSGASAGTHSPSLTTPGVGAAGPRRTPVPTRPPSRAVPTMTAVDPGSAAAPGSTAYRPADQTAPAPSVSPAVRCQTGDGQHDKGHGKHKCRGGGGGGQR